MKARHIKSKGSFDPGLYFLFKRRSSRFLRRSAERSVLIPDDHERLHPVEVSRDRIIRHVVGLRPYRPDGFRIQKEDFSGKQLIHNYGHGGGGISLSWGTAAQAIAMIDYKPGSSVAVLGCGVIGLSTAILLLRRGYQVTIYTRELPPKTTSNVSGALWAPVSSYDPGRVDGAFLSRFEKAAAVSQRMFQDLVGERYGVRWIRNFYPGGFDFPGGRSLYPGIREYGPENAWFDCTFLQEAHTFLIEPPIYLKALQEDVLHGGGKIIVRSFQCMDDLAGLEEQVIMNCTGLGSRLLFQDNALIPVKGQVTVLLPQPEIDYSYVVPTPGARLYMFPRKDGIVLGGNSVADDWSMDPDPDETERVLQAHSSISAYMNRQSKP